MQMPRFHSCALAAELGSRNGMVAPLHAFDRDPGCSDPRAQEPIITNGLRGKSLRSKILAQEPANPTT